MLMIFHNQLSQPVSKKRCVEGLFIPKDPLLFDSSHVSRRKQEELRGRKLCEVFSGGISAPTPEKRTPPPVSIPRDQLRTSASVSSARDSPLRHPETLADFLKDKEAEPRQAKIPLFSASLPKLGPPFNILKRNSGTLY